MVETNIRIPLAGTFNISSGTFKNHDIIKIANNKFLAYVQQENQSLGYLAIIEYTNFVNSFDYTVIKQTLLFRETAIAMTRLYRLSDIRALLVIDNNAHVINIENNEISIELTEAEFFVMGLLNVGLNLNSRKFEILTGDNLADNELLMIENEVPVLTSVAAALYKLYHVVYNPTTNELTKTLRIDFADLNNINNPTVALAQIRGSVKTNISPIVGTNNYYLAVSCVIGTLNSSANVTQIFSGIIDQSGNILEFIDIPTTSFTPKTALALNSNIIIYFDTTLLVRVYNRELNEFTNPMPLTGITNTSTINNLIYLDASNFFIQYENNRFRVINSLTNSLFQINSFEAIYSTNFQDYKNHLVKWNNELLIGFGVVQTITIDGEIFVDFPIIRINQSLS